MPIAVGGQAARGRTGGRSACAIPGARFLRGHPFRSPWFSTKNETISGITKDSTGSALGSCMVQLFRTPSDQFVGEMLSDASGNYSFDNPGSGPFYIVAYKAGAPDVAGTTVNTLVGA